MMSPTRLALAAFFAAALGAGLTASADGGRRPPPGPRPPKAAFDACAKAQDGAQCTFDHDGHRVDGTCRRGPDGNGPLACAPAHPPPPPREALDACEKLGDGDACAVTIDGDTVDGTCRRGPDGGGPLACAPNDPPPPSSSQSSPPSSASAR